MTKGLKKFTVYYSGRYFDGGRIYGARVVFSSDALAATRKVQDIFDRSDDEPIMSAGLAKRWESSDEIGEEIYPYWE